MVKLNQTGVVGNEVTMPQAAKGRSPEQEEKAEKPDVLKKVVDDFNASWNYTQSNYHNIWEDCWKLYNNKRVDKAYDGISNTFVPITFSTIETMVAALAGSRPRFDFKATKPEQQTDTKVINALMDYYWDTGKWQSIVDRWIRSMLMYGTGVLYIYWDIDHPCLINVPIRDFFFDPTASDMSTARYVGRRYLTTVDELEDYKYYDENGEAVNVYKNLDKISSGSDTGEETDKEKKDMLLGSTLGKDAKGKQVEVIEYWTDEHVYVIANRSTVIREDKNPYLEAAELRGDENPKGLLPFIVQRDYADESLFLGKGEIEPIKYLQEQLNDLTNQNQDAVTFIINQQYTLDPEYADYIEEVQNVPGGVYPFREGALAPVPRGSIPADAFNERLNIKSEIRETTAVDQAVKGVAQDTKTTATEVVQQINQASQRFGVKVAQIESEGYYDLAKLVVAIVQLFVTKPMMVRIIGDKQGIEWAVYEPSFYQGSYEPMVQLESKAEAQKDIDRKAAQESYIALLNNPFVDQKELTKFVMQKVFDMDEDEVALLMPDNLQQGIPGMAPDPMADPMADPLMQAPMMAPDPMMEGVPSVG